MRCVYTCCSQYRFSKFLYYNYLLFLSIKRFLYSLVELYFNTDSIEHYTILLYFFSWRQKIIKWITFQSPNDKIVDKVNITYKSGQDLLFSFSFLVRAYSYWLCIKHFQSMSTSTSDNGLFNGQFDARIFLAIFVPAIFLLIIILTMLVFLMYRQPSYYDSYIIDHDHVNYDNEKSDSKFEILSRTPISYA